MGVDAAARREPLIDLRGHSCGIGSFRQRLLLGRRNAGILARNRLALAILIGSPILVLAMFRDLFRPHAFGPGRPSPEATVMILF
jgi:hypothetical protein